MEVWWMIPVMIGGIFYFGLGLGMSVVMAFIIDIEGIDELTWNVAIAWALTLPLSLPLTVLALGIVRISKAIEWAWHRLDSPIFRTKGNH